MFIVVLGWFAILLSLNTTKKREREQRKNNTVEDLKILRRENTEFKSRFGYVG